MAGCSLVHPQCPGPAPLGFSDELLIPDLEIQINATAVFRMPLLPATLVVGEFFEGQAAFQPHRAGQHTD
jgi:hypothetical protein